MSENSPNADRRDLLKKALQALDEMQAKVRAIERSRTEPIAIVGMGCRFPGDADSPAAYWQLLRDGVNAVTDVPPGRWGRERYNALDPELAATLPSPGGGFLSDVEGFDPGFFGISPREAVSMDPQQRLVLEVSWEALEHAGIDPTGLTGSATGVFVGVTASDYWGHLRSADPTHLDVYIATGNSHNATAGRVSFTLGLQGPAMAVDTACSSSLAAVHLACQSLRLGESNLALAGGVNTMHSPDSFFAFFKWGMTAPDGRCKTFDDSADGFVRSEGCGMVVLKRLSDAVSDGDRILALIRGSAVNQDGASSGFTVPNGLAQEAVIRQALRVAGVEPAAVSYVEAHGTGTSLGDPDRAGIARRGARTRPRSGSAAHRRIGEDESRAPRIGGGHGRVDQGRPLASARRDSSASPFHDAQSARIVPRSAADCADARHALADRRASHRRRELLRHQRHERARHRRRSGSDSARSISGRPPGSHPDDLRAHAGGAQRSRRAMAGMCFVRQRAVVGRRRFHREYGACAFRAPNRAGGAVDRSGTRATVRRREWRDAARSIPRRDPIRSAS